jgi:phage terminase Nu1 subunit (DNA packaging protein)
MDTKLKQIMDEISKLTITEINELIKALEEIPESFYQALIEVKDKEIDKLKKEIKMLEKLIELNMNDLWDIADQRDWYYDIYRKMKEKYEGCLL